LQEFYLVFVSDTIHTATTDHFTKIWCL